MNDDLGRYSVRSGLPQNCGIPLNQVISMNQVVPQSPVIPHSPDITHFLCIPHVFRKVQLAQNIYLLFQTEGGFTLISYVAAKSNSMDFCLPSAACNY